MANELKPYAASALKEVLKNHKKYLDREPGGGDADLRGANLRGSDLVCADLRYADLGYADLRGANLGGADLRGANLGSANLSSANLGGSDLGGADLRGADLRGANLGGANLSSANLGYADLRGANLSASQGLLDAIDYLTRMFEATKEGVVVYKTFGLHSNPNPAWAVEAGSTLSEVVNPNPTNDCGCGVNVATKEWIKNNDARKPDVWRCLIRWAWLPGVVVPYNTDGKIRCARVELVEIVKDFWEVGDGDSD